MNPRRGTDITALATQTMANSSRAFLTSDVLIVPDHIFYRNENAFSRLQELAVLLEPGTVLVVGDDFGGIYRYQDPGG